jgi:WD40 repeat protein
VDERKVRLWDVAAKAERAVLKGHSSGVRSVAFDATGSLLASGGDDGTVRLWDVAAKAERAVLKGHSGRVTSVAFDATNSLLASAGADGTVRLWDVAAKAERAVLKGHSGWVRSVAFDATGSLLASGGDDGTMRLWDLTSLDQALASKPPQLFEPNVQVIVPHPVAPFSPSWAEFDGTGNLIQWSDSAVDHWLFSQRDGRVAPIESVL